MSGRPGFKPLQADGRARSRYMEDWPPEEASLLEEARSKKTALPAALGLRWPLILFHFVGSKLVRVCFLSPGTEIN